jgi:hypothetical protein
MAWQQEDLQSAASAWVQLSAQHQRQHQLQDPTVYLTGSLEGYPDAAGVKLATQLATAPVAATFFPQAYTQGITLYEPFGGLCAGLEMVLRNGFRVAQYYYSDTDAVSQRIAYHRLRQLQCRYPDQLPLSAIQAAFSTMPMDVRAVTTSHLQHAMQQAAAEQWLVVGGWPCQDFSLAGPGRGLAGSRSKLLHELVGIIGSLQQLCSMQHLPPPAYVLENVGIQYHRQSSIAQHDFSVVCGMVGQPVFLDAAQLGSLAHRPRNFWSNLCSPWQLREALRCAERPAGRTVELALQPGRQAQPVQRPDRAPQYPCNWPGQSRAAWPTLMGRRQSYAFRPGQPGAVQDSSSGQPVWAEPSALEREIALGYLPGSTAAQGLTDGQRCSALGQCMDANTLQALMAVSKAVWFRSARTQPGVPFASALPAASHYYSGLCSQSPSAGWVSPNWAAEVAASAATGAPAGTVSPGQCQPLPGHPPPLRCRKQAGGCPDSSSIHPASLAAAAASLEQQHGDSGEIWLDHPALAALRSGSVPADLSAADKHRVRQRLQLYSWQDAQQGAVLVRHMPDGSTRVVPDPSARPALVVEQHVRCGHFGVRRTAAMLQTKYWWRGLRTDVQQLLRRCEHCSRVQAAFNAKPAELYPIPISSMGFRWHVDLAGPLPLTNRKHSYVMVAVEAFSKHLEAVPMPDKTADTVAFALLQHVIAKFGAPGQVVTDNGAEFGGAFAKLLSDCHIDHCHTSPGHPQANGQAEKAVCIVKTALRKMVDTSHEPHNWDLDLAWLCLGYRCTPHSSSGFSPYELLYARPVVIPPAALEMASQPLDYDSPDLAADDLDIRRKRLQRHCPMALENLAIAQHRDQRRYLQVRQPDYKPPSPRFEAGDFVYTRQQQRNSSLQPRARPAIYRVLEVRPSGVLLLQGRCGGTFEEHMVHCAPCHLPGIDPTIDPQLAVDLESIVCEVCETDQQPDLLLLCDYCNQGYHTHCLEPPLTGVPAGVWLCPVCISNNVAVADAEQQAAQRAEAARRAGQPNIFPAVAGKAADLKAQALHERLVCKPFTDPATKQQRSFWGRLHYRGGQYRPFYFRVLYEDGDEEDCRMADIQRYVMPASTALPAGVSLPAFVAAGAMLEQYQRHYSTQCMLRDRHLALQQLAAGALPQQLPVPATVVPAAALQQLQQLFSFRFAQELLDPVTQSLQLLQWAQRLPVAPVPVGSQPPTSGAAVIFMAPEAQQLSSSLAAALHMGPALLCCYFPVPILPQGLRHSFAVLQPQQRAQAIPTEGGLWLAVAPGPCNLRLWRQLG